MRVFFKAFHILISVWVVAMGKEKGEHNHQFFKIKLGGWSLHKLKPLIFNTIWFVPKQP